MFCGWCNFDPVTSGLGHLANCPSAVADATQARRLFVPNRDLSSALASVERDSPVLALPMTHPLIRCALKDAETQEEGRWKLKLLDGYSCPACRAPFDWAGALFVHLIGCAAYATMIDNIPLAMPLTIPAGSPSPSLEPTDDAIHEDQSE